MVMGSAVSTVYYNLQRRHPTLDLPIIDYDLALLIQPMLMLGISIGVTFNVIFPDWLVTVLLIILFVIMSIRAFQKGFEAWNKETAQLRDDAAVEPLQQENGENRPLLDDHQLAMHRMATGPSTYLQVPIWENVYWKEFWLLCFVWVSFLTLQVTKNYTPTCSIWYWVLNFLQVPVSVGVTAYEIVGLLSGRRIINSIGENSNGEEERVVSPFKLIVYCSFGILAGMVGGLLGLGGGFILSPLFIELGIPPQVGSATSTFAMMFSSSMSVVEYYLLKRFPVEYAAYFVALTLFSAWIGQRFVKRLITDMGRESIIILIMALVIFVSAISLGGFGIVGTIDKLEKHEDMGFLSLCDYKV